MKRTGLLLCATLLLAACAPSRVVVDGRGNAKPHPHAAHGAMPAWRLADLATAEGTIVRLNSPTGTALAIEAARVRLMLDAAQRTLAAAGPGDAPDWLLIGTPAPNAYAAWQDGKPIVAVTLGMAHLLGEDADAWAALFGHELAHFRLGHHEALRTRRQATEIGSSLVGLALSVAGIGLGGVVADATGSLVERAFSREDERDADRLGLDIQRRAGFDGRGALRLQQALLHATHAAAPGFLGTHPGGEERIARLRRLLEEPPR